MRWPGVAVLGGVLSGIAGRSGAEEAALTLPPGEAADTVESLSWTVHDGWLYPGADLFAASLTVPEAKLRCRSTPACKGFTFQGALTPGVPKEVHFKSKWALGGAGEGWTSYRARHTVQATFMSYDGFITPGGDLITEELTLEEAKVRCTSLPRCRGFTYQAGGPMFDVAPTFLEFLWSHIFSQPVPFLSVDIPPSADGLLTVHFKEKWEVAAPNLGWTSYRLQEEQPVLFTVHDGWLYPEGDIATETLRVEEAKEMCAKLPVCSGFTFEGSPTTAPVKVHLKSHTQVGGQGSGWTSYCRAGTLTPREGVEPLPAPMAGKGRAAKSPAAGKGRAPAKEL